MADAAMAYAANGYEVYFVTVEPEQEFFSGQGRETMMQLLTKAPNKVNIGSVKVGREFEFGTPAYVAYVYKKLLLANIPLGTPIILSDDSTVWAAAAALHQSYPLVGVLHADEPHYYHLAKQYKDIVDIFVCVSDRVSITVKERSPQINSGRVFVVPCGIQLPPVHKTNTQTGILQLVYVGRITDYQKRTSDLAKVAVALKNKNIPFYLNIIGDGLETKVELEKTVIAEGLQGQITFTGWLSQAKVHEYLCAADVMILMSDFEGMPIAMMEGLASGCGFVGTRVSGIEDYEYHPLAKDCFAVFAVGDIGGAVDKIQQVAAIAPGIRRVAARKLAEEQFSMATCLANYNNAIATIPGRKYSSVSNELPVTDLVKSRFTSMLRTAKMTIAKK